MSQIVEEAFADLNTFHGTFRIRSIRFNEEKAVVLDKGDPKTGDCPIVRIQSSCLFGESFGSTDCDCRWQIHHSLDKIQNAGAGVFIYLFQEGRGVGLLDKIRLYRTEQEHNCDTVEAFKILGFSEPDLRHYDLGPEILRFLGYDCCHLLTNNPEKIKAFQDAGISTTPEEMLREPSDFKELLTSIGDANPSKLLQYLQTKKSQFSHRINTNKMSKAIRDLSKRKR